LKRKLLTAVQKGMYVSMTRNTSVLMLIEQTICTYDYSFYSKSCTPFTNFKNTNSH